MDMVKVTIASGSMFLEPDEIASLFQRAETGKGKRVLYDHQNHHFIVECRLVDAEKVSIELTEVIRNYLYANGSNVEAGLGVLEINKVRPINDDDIWELVERTESTQNAAIDSGNLIPRYSTSKAFKYSEKEAVMIFSREALADVGRDSGCDIDIDTLAKVIRIGGWSRESIDTAEKLLATIEESYDRSTLGSYFDFVNDEGQKKMNIRLVKPVHILDPKHFAPGQPTLCELSIVEWMTQSRHWRISRKEQSSLPKADCELWLEPIHFMHTRQRNDPNRWCLLEARDEPVLEGRSLSIQKLGRTTQWAHEISETPLDPYSNVEADGYDNLLRRPDRQLLGTTRIIKSDRAYAHIEIEPVPSFAATNTAINPPHGDMRALEQTNDCHKIDFDKLKGPGRNHDIASGDLWSTIDAAHRSIMEQASMHHRSSISFELHLGHVYVYALTVEHAELRPQRKSPSEPFSLERWTEIFRTKSGASGASTVFSPRLSSRDADISFVLDIKMGKNERVIDRKPKHRVSWFEIHCRDPYSKSEAIVEIHDKGSVRIEGKDEQIGGINFHHPARTWDCSWNVAARKQLAPSERASNFKELIDNVFVKYDASGDHPILYSRANIEILKARLVKQSIHRTRQEQIVFSLQHVTRLGVVKYSEDCFELSPDKDLDSLNEDREPTTWWEAKLVAPSLQRVLEENKEMGMGRSTWSADAGSLSLRLMLQLAGHLVPRMDNVGFLPPSARH